MGIGDFVSDIGGAVKDGFENVVEGVFDVVDDVFGIDLAKVLDNDFVKYGLMAASIFTGGVAIVNGVMQGAGSFAGTTGAFMDKFIAGAGSFVKGVASGFGSPLESAGNIIDGTAYTAAKTAATTGGQLIAEGANSSAAMDTLAGTDQSSNLQAGVDEALGLNEGIDASQLNADVSAGLQESGVSSAGGAPAGGDYSLVDQKVAAGLSPEEQALQSRALKGQVPSSTTSNVNSPNYNMDAAINNSGPLKVGAEAAPKKDWLGRLADSASSFVTSPAGVQMGLGAIQGWSQAEQMKAIYEERRKMRNDVARSWGGGGTSAPRTWDIPALSELRARRQQLDQRGNEAQARYGY